MPGPPPAERTRRYELAQDPRAEYRRRIRTVLPGPDERRPPLCAEKEPIALAVAVAIRCEPCIDAHVEKCLRAGAAEAEILEAAGVAVVMGGGPASTYAPLAVAALRQRAATEQRGAA